MISLATNPYVYCAANPIRFIDPSGCILFITGDDAKVAFEQLKNAVKGITISMSEDGAVSFTRNKKGKLNENAKKLIEAIENDKITVKVTAQTSSDMSDGTFFVGGAFMGNEYDDKTGCVSTSQTVCPTELAQMDKADGKRGKNIMHEISESYEGGLMALENKKGDSTHGDSNSYYADAHTKATPQTPINGATFSRTEDSNVTRVTWLAGTKKLIEVKSRTFPFKFDDALPYVKNKLLNH